MTLARALVTLALVATGLPLATVALADPTPAPSAPAPSAVPAPEREKLEGEKLDALLAEIARARRAVKTLRSGFTQERKLTLLATSVKSSGQLAFVAPDRLRWELGPPDDVVYWIGPEGLSYRTRSSSATVPSGGANVAKALADLRALLGGDLASLKERYVLGGSRGSRGSSGGADVEITGTAKEKTASVRAFSLVLDKTMTLPVKARLLEGKSDAIEIAFQGPAINVPIDPATMKP